MDTFAIISPATNPKMAELNAAVARVFPTQHFEIAPGQFVAAARDLNAVQIGERLGPSGEIGQFVVFSIGAQYGWHRRDLWDWLKARAAE